MARGGESDRIDDDLRIDKWLWYARFFKSRALATKVCQSGKVRVDGTPISKAHFIVRIGQVLTFPQGPHIRVVRVEKFGARRGPAPEAQTLYADLAPIAAHLDDDAQEETPRQQPAPGLRERGAGRPTKADRRAIDRLRQDG